MLLPRIAARVFNAPLLIHPGKAAAMLSGIGARIAGRETVLVDPHPVDHVAFANGRPSMGTVGDRLGRSIDRRGQRAYDMIGGVAIIPIEGSLVHKGAWLESDSGETSYQGIQTQVARAMRDNDVKAVVLEIDSMGGELSGAFETSDMIFELSQAKPTLAILSDHAASAGYLMASAARQMIVPEHGSAGSIGVIAIHTDMSAALEQNGLAVTILAAGAHKADGNPFEALPEPVGNKIRAELEVARQAFAQKVATYRGKRISFDEIMATEAQVFTGAEAVRNGLADATGHPSKAFQAFVSTINRA